MLNGARGSPLPVVGGLQTGRVTESAIFGERLKVLRGKRIVGELLIQGAVSVNVRSEVR